MANGRGEYSRAAPETRRALVNAGVISVGVLIGIAAWPRYKREKPIGVIGLGASGSMVAAGIVGLLIGQQPGGGS